MSRTKTVQRLVLAYLLAPLPYLALGLFYDLLIELFAIVNFFGSNVRGWAYSISGGIYMQFVYLWNLVLVVPASIYFIRRRQSGFTWSIALAFIVAVLTYWTTNLLTPGGKQFHPELFEFSGHWHQPCMQRVGFSGGSQFDPMAQISKRGLRVTYNDRSSYAAAVPA